MIEQDVCQWVSTFASASAWTCVSHAAKEVFRYLSRSAIHKARYRKLLRGDDFPGVAVGSRFERIRWIQRMQQQHTFQQNSSGPIRIRKHAYQYDKWRRCCELQCIQLHSFAIPTLCKYHVNVFANIPVHSTIHHPESATAENAASHPLAFAHGG